MRLTNDVLTLTGCNLYIAFLSVSRKEEPMERRFEVRLEKLLEDAVPIPNTGGDGWIV